MIRALFVFVAAFLLGAPGDAAGQSAGQVDASFEVGSLVNGSVEAIVPASEGKLYLGGKFTTVRGAPRNRIARLMADGSVDSSFDPGQGANNDVECLAVQADGKVILGGWFTRYDGTVRNRIARIHADGTLDTSFDPGSGTNGVVASLAVQNDGKVLIGGWFTSVNGIPRNYIARLNADGSVDTSFDPGDGASSGVIAVAAGSDGKVLIGGYFTSYDGSPGNRLARLLSDGTLDPGFDTGSGANGIVSSLALQGDGKVLVGGSFTDYNGTGRNRIARINADGTLDASFNPGTGANGTVTSLALQADGKVLIGGWFTSYNGTARGYVARIDEEGELDASFDPGGGAQGLVFCVAVQGDGKSLVGGQFNRFDSLPFSYLARLGLEGSLDPGFVPGTGQNGGVSSLARQLDGKTILAGDFTFVDGVARSRIARIEEDGSLDTAFDPGDGADARIETVSVLADGKILIAGDFMSYDGVARSRIARLHADGSLDTSFDPGSGADGTIRCAGVQPDGKVLVGGDFTTYDGVARGRIARLNANGSLDGTFAPVLGADAVVATLALQPDGKVVLAGDFTTYEGSGSGRIVRLNADASIDATFDQVSLADGMISCVMVQADGKLLFGGDFLSYDGVGRARVARLESDGSLDTTFDPGSGVNGMVFSMVLQADGKVLLGGGFSVVGGSNRRNVARLKADGSVDPDFDPLAGANGTVYALALQEDGKLLLGGEFSVYDETASSFLARVHNGAATRELNAVSPSRVEWLRGGSAPELEQVSFELSDDGNVWTPLGTASRFNGGWELEGLSLPLSGFLRASGRAATGLNSGSSSMLEQVESYVFPPEISVEQPEGVELANGIGGVDFGSFALGGSSARTFTIRNKGYGILSDLILTLGGTDGDDFTVTASPSTTVPPGGTTTFTLELDPSIAGSKTALLSIASNDTERNPFEVPLFGTMLKGSQNITFDPIADQPATATVNLAATGGPSGNPVTFSVEGPAQLSGTTLSFTGGGAVTVTANQAGNANYDAAPPVEHAFAVTAVPVSVTLTGLSHVYDGTPKTAGATTNPEGIPVQINYGGPAPVNAGSHPVSASVTDPRYSGSTSDTLVIAKGTQAIVFAPIDEQLATTSVNLSATGGGSGNSVNFVADGPAELVGTTLSFTGPGTVTVTANQAGNENYDPAPPVERSFAVTAVPVSVTLTDLFHVYDGLPKTAGAATNPAGVPVQFDYGGPAPVNPGSYPVSATVSDTRYIGTTMGTLVIAKAMQSIIFVAIGDQFITASVNLSATGGGSGNAVTFAIDGPAELDGTTLRFTGLGTVTVTANQAGNANYEAAPEVSQVISVTADTATLALSRLHQVADGTAREVSVTTTPPDLDVVVTYDGEPEAPTDPGTYLVEASVGDARYQGEASANLVVDTPSRLVAVPSGTLPPSSPLGEAAVPAFLVGAYEVTSSEWDAVVAWAEAAAGYDFGGVGLTPAGDHPVTEINWFDAAKWCNARTEWENDLRGTSLAPVYQLGGNVFKTGNPSSPSELTCDFGSSGYRLPTSAEWEHAARGGGPPSIYPGGNDLDLLGWFAANSGGAGTLPAGGKIPNGLNVHDLAGNAAEWTWDASSGSPAQRIARGGSWSSSQNECELGSTAEAAAVLRSDRIGFRVARSVATALAAALDLPEGTWETGGDSLWFAQTETSFDGVDAAESGVLGLGQSNWIETSVTGPGSVTFQWKVASSDELDRLSLSVNGTEALARGGSGDWEERVVEVGEGAQVLRWTYTRASESGEARAWVDAVDYAPDGPPTVTSAAATGLTETTATLGGTVVSDGGREVSVRGVVVSTSPEPSLGQGTDLPDSAGGEGSFSVAAVGLQEGTTYFARAYATNNLGTGYGEEVVFTTGTTVVFEGGLASYERTMFPGDRHAFRFTLSGPKVFGYASAGDAALRADLRDGSGTLLHSFEGDGNFDLRRTLLAGDYVLQVFRQSDLEGVPQAFTLTLDERTAASTRPDVAVGAVPSRLVGRLLYSPRNQRVLLVSKKARRITAHIRVANRGNLPDVLGVRGARGNAFFKVAYFGPGNVTGSVLTGRFRTSPLVDGGEVPLRVTIAPNKRKLSKKRGAKKVILRKALNLQIRATSTLAPALGDAATIRAQTR